MANISREEDERDFQERMANGGNRPNVLRDRPKTHEEELADLESELESLKWRLRSARETQTQK